MSNGFKVIAIGTTNVGKTSILNRIISNKFDDQVIPTTTSTAYTKEYMGITSKFTISYWDTAGQEKYKSLVPLFYQGARLAIAVFDINEPSTFDEMIDYIRKFSEISNTNSNSSNNLNYSVSTFNLNEKANVIVAANKIDQTTGDYSDLFDKYSSRLFSDSSDLKSRILYIVPTSAKTGYGITDIEQYIIDWINQNMLQPKQAMIDDENVCISNPIDPNTESKSCC